MRRRFVCAVMCFDGGDGVGRRVDRLFTRLADAERHLADWDASTRDFDTPDIETFELFGEWDDES